MSERELLAFSFLLKQSLLQLFCLFEYEHNYFCPITELLQSYGALTSRQAHSYLELEINFLEATHSNDRERAGFFFLVEAVATSAILFCVSMHMTETYGCGLTLQVGGAYISRRGCFLEFFLHILRTSTVSIL